MNRPSIIWCSLAPANGHPEKPLTIGNSLTERFNRLSVQEFAGDQDKTEDARLRGEVRFARAKVSIVE